MGRRRSGGSGTTRLLQGLFALAWIVFLCYMVSGYLGRQAKDENAQLDQTSSAPDNATEGNGEPSLTLPGSNLANAKTEKQTPPASDLSGPNANQIVQNVVSAYRNATAYSDDGELIMSSTINGRPIDGRYRWKTSWMSNGNLAADIFDASVRSDGRMLSCFVSSIEKQNLDNQQLFLTGRDLVNQLYADSIANFYLNGGDRIPVNETKIPRSAKLAPLPLSLLTGQVGSQWLTSSRVTRLRDEVLKNEQKTVVADCYVIQFESIDGEFTAWIDKSNSIIRQLQFPVEYLDPLLTSDPNIKDFRLMASMLNAKFAASETQFERVYPRSADIWPVKRFVATTQALPSNLIGQTVPEFELFDSNRKSVTDRDFMGKTTVLMWLDDDEFNGKLIDRFIKTQKALQDNAVQFQIVAGPALLRRGENGTWIFSTALQPLVNRSSLPFLADRDGLVGKSFEFEAFPSVVVIDPDLNVQFAEQLTTPFGYNGIPKIRDGWERGLISAIEATRKGVDVAQDMLVEYNSFLEKYDMEKRQNLAAGLFPQFVVKGATKVAAVPAKVRREKMAEKAKLQLNPRLVWKSNRLEMPGGIAEVPDQNRRPTRHLILDGWQTITMFSLDGNFLAEKKLNLPDRAAVTSIRPVLSGKGESAFAMFSVGGRQVFLFDGKMNLVAKFPQQPSNADSILACEVIEGAANRNDKLLICYRGSRGAEMVDPFAATVKTAGPTIVRSVSIQGRDVVAVDDRSGALLSMDDGRVLDGNREYVHVRNGAVGASKFAATAMNDRQEWSLVGLGNDLKQAWAFPIASAIFENGLDPVDGVETSPGKGIWAVVDSTNRIFLLSDTGQWLGDLAGDGNVRGISLIKVGTRTRLLVSTEKLVECWDLNFAPERIGQVGSRTE